MTWTRGRSPARRPSSSGPRRRPAADQHSPGRAPALERHGWMRSGAAGRLHAPGAQRHPAAARRPPTQCRVPRSRTSARPACRPRVPQDDALLDDIIDRLLDVRTGRPGKQVALSETEVRARLCTALVGKRARLRAHWLLYRPASR